MPGFLTSNTTLVAIVDAEGKIIGDGNPLSVVGGIAGGGGLAPEEYDRIELTYDGDDISTVTYRLDGAVVGTLTLSYAEPGVLSSVQRS